MVIHTPGMMELISPGILRLWAPWFGLWAPGFGWSKRLMGALAACPRWEEYDIDAIDVHDHPLVEALEDEIRGLGGRVTPVPEYVYSNALSHTDYVPADYFDWLVYRLEIEAFHDYAASL